MLQLELSPVEQRPWIKMKAYVPERYDREQVRQKLPAILILPGGAYRFHSEYECAPMALRFCMEGFACFVLYYSVGAQAAYPAPLEDASQAMVTIRRRAREWWLDPCKIAVMGFSAGAHLAGALCTMWHLPELQTGISPRENRPDAAVLGYLPTGFTQLAEKLRREGSDATLPVLGKGRFAQLDAFTLTTQVDRRTPPAFVWKTTRHLPENGMAYAQALQKYDISFEVHIFSDDVPNNGVLDVHASACNTPMWVPMAVKWLYYILNESK